MKCARRAPVASAFIAALVASSCGAGDAEYGAPLGGDGAWSVSVRLPEHVEPAYEHIILVTIDTLRSDHVSSYGYFRQTTPYLDSLAEGGVLFENAVAAVSQTAPSHASMMTGLSLYEHGVSENGYVLSPDANDLARVFAGAGYDTAAFLSAGFLAGIAGHFGHVEADGQVARDVFGQAEAWLQAPERKARSFVWIHTFDAHRWRFTSHPPERLIDIVRGGTQESDAEIYGRVAAIHGLPAALPDGTVDLDWIVSVRELGRIEGETVRDYLDFIDAYDALILYGDFALRAFHESVEAMKLPGRTLWIVTSDHGEGLASHRVAGHGNRLFQEQLSVPLVVFANDDSLTPRRVPDVVQLIDLYPTLLATLDARTTGLSPELNGASLWPLLRGDEATVGRPAFSQRRSIEDDAGEDRAGVGRQSRVNVPSQANIGELFAIQTARYKLIKGESTEQLFDLEADPLELNDIADEAAAEADRLRALLDERLEYYRLRRPARRDQDLSDETMEELRALGYVD